MLSFRPLTWEDRVPYSELYGRTSVKYAEYSFFSLWGWGDTNPMELAWDGALCWLRSHGSKPGFCSPVGDWDTADWDTLLREHFTPGDILLDVPEAVVGRFSDSLAARLEVTEDRDEWEYLHSVPELIALDGSHFAQKRSSYDWEYIPLLPEDFPELLDFQARWLRHKEASSPSLEDEDRAIRRALERWDELPFLGALLRADGTTVGYTIAEELDAKTLDIRFEKALEDYAGSYQALNRLFLQNQGSDYAWVNREEDMGNPGLREAKLSYHPVRLLKKYRVEILSVPRGT